MPGIDLSGLDHLKSNEIVLVLSSSQNYVQNNLRVLKALLKTHDCCIYVTLNKPANSLMELFGENGLKQEQFYFLDGVTELVGGKVERNERVLAIAPQNLTAMSIAINEMISGLNGKKFVFLDSLSTLALFNSAGNVNKFYHFLTNKIRVSNLKGIFLSVEKDLSPELLGILEKVVDRVIRI